VRTLENLDEGKSPLTMMDPGIPLVVSYETRMKRALTCESDVQKVISYFL